MKGFDKIKTLQLVLLIIVSAAALIAVFRDRDLYALIAADPSARLISIILWLTLAGGFLFLLYDFSNYAQMRRENLQLDRAMHSDALTGVANRYSIDAYLGQFHDRPLPANMGAITLQITNLGETNEQLGHGAGDLEIQTFAGLLQQCASGPCFIGRNGGDKFVVILRDCTADRIRRYLGDLDERIREHNEKQDDAGIAYCAGTAFAEGEDVGTVNALVALSDKRARAKAENREEKNN